MNALKVLVMCFAVLVNFPVVAQQKQPPLFLPSPSNPAIAAFMTWHQSVLKGDYVAYKNASFWLTDSTEELKRQMFENLRSNTPAVVKVGEQKTNANGSVGFYAVGCKDNVRLISVITVGNKDGAWRVAASLWGPPWNETAKLCPV